MARHATLVTITPPPEVDPAGTAAFWATMAEILNTGWRRRLREGRGHIAVEYRWTGRQLTIAVWVPATVATGPVQACTVPYLAIGSVSWPFVAGSGCPVILVDDTAEEPLSPYRRVERDDHIRVVFG